MSISPIVVPSHGPRDAKLMLLAEAPGERETERGVPLVGPSGWELRRMLRIIGVDLNDCFKANVFCQQPEGNLIGHFGQPDRATAAATHLGPLTTNPTLFLRQEFHRDSLDRLYREIVEVDPHVIVALGNTATWALGLGTGITALRGTVHLSNAPELPRPVKVLPTFHPAAVLRDWSLRTIAIADLQKAVNESASPHLAFDNTTLWLNPALEDLVEFDRDHMQPSRICAADIETKRGQITAISFAPSVDHSLCIPFWTDGADPNYWPTPSAEREAWAYVKRWLESPAITKVFQNGLYDLQYIYEVGIRPRACTADTMLAHHSLYSELQKGLGFLGSIYAHTPSWKSMRQGVRKDELLKRDD